MPTSDRFDFAVACVFRVRGDLTFYNHEQPQMTRDNLGTQTEALDRLLPTLNQDEIKMLLTGDEEAGISDEIFIRLN